MKCAPQFEAGIVEELAEAKIFYLLSIIFIAFFCKMSLLHNNTLITQCCQPLSRQLLLVIALVASMHFKVLEFC